MGYDDRDDSYRARSQAPRRRSYESDDHAPAPRSAPRDMGGGSGPRSRAPRRDYDDDEYGRRGPRSVPGGANGSSGRYPREEYERRPGPSAPPRRGNESGGGYNSYANRPSRASWSDPGASTPRGGRAPVRDDAWGEPRGPRSNGANSYGGRSAPSDGRMRRVAPGGRGGLWGEESGAYNAQAVRARTAAQQVDDDEEEEGSVAAGVAKAIGAIILALIIGVGAAYGYYVMSAPKLHATPYQQPTTPTASPSASPSASATTTGLIYPPSGGPTLFVG